MPKEYPPIWEPTPSTIPKPVSAKPGSIPITLRGDFKGHILWLHIILGDEILCFFTGNIPGTLADASGCVSAPAAEESHLRGGRLLEILQFLLGYLCFIGIRVFAHQFFQDELGIGRIA